MVTTYIVVAHTKLNPLLVRLCCTASLLKYNAWIRSYYEVFRAIDRWCQVWVASSRSKLRKVQIQPGLLLALPSFLPRGQPQLREIGSQEFHMMRRYTRWSIFFLYLPTVVAQTIWPHPDFLGWHLHQGSVILSRQLEHVLHLLWQEAVCLPFDAQTLGDIWLPLGAGIYSAIRRYHGYISAVSPNMEAAASSTSRIGSSTTAAALLRTNGSHAEPSKDAGLSCTSRLSKQLRTKPMRWQAIHANSGAESGLVIFSYINYRNWAIRAMKEECGGYNML